MPPALTTTQLEAYYALTEVSALLRHAIEKQLRDAGRLSYVQSSYSHVCATPTICGVR
jgi:hypothetical protein